MRFRTTLLQSGPTATGFEVPADVVASLGKGKRPPVVVTVNGYTYRNTVAVFGDVFMIGISAEHRAASGIRAGDELEVEVDLALDLAPRVVEVSPDLAAALDAEPEARRTFDALSYSNQSWHVLSVNGAKTDETRQRRIEKSVATLREGRPR
ncbi:MAG: YdeI/OmpD-associated family protein [Candidatus Limnocylindrales bacterium]